MKQFQMQGIESYYGGLHVKQENGKFYWAIENWDGWDYEEIPESLFIELLKHYNSNKMSPDSLR